MRAPIITPPGGIAPLVSPMNDVGGAFGFLGFFSTDGVNVVAARNDGTMVQVFPGGGAGGTGNPNAIVFNDATGTVLVADNALVAAPPDAFGRPQIWDNRNFAGTGAVFRQGSWTADGDPTDQTGQGVVIYGPNALGAGPNATDGGEGRVKSDRFALAQIVNGVNGNNLFSAWRSDHVRMFASDDANNVIYELVRLGDFSFTPVANGNFSVSLSGTGQLTFTVAGSLIQIDAAGNITLLGPAGSQVRLLTSGSVQAVTAALSLEVSSTGEIILNGNPGAAGERITSGGPGVPVSWAP